MANNNIFTLDDGTQEFVITNKYGEEICKLHIRGGDLSIIDRYNELMKDFDTIIEPLSGMKLNAEGDVEHDEQFDSNWQIIKDVQKTLIDRIDALFDMHDASKLFEKRNAFSTVGGVFYVEKVIEMLGNIVNQAIEEEAKKSQKRLDKYMKDKKA